MFPSKDENVPNLRFPEFKDGWKIKYIKDIFKERIEKHFDNLELLSVTIDDGVIKRSEIEDKDNSSKNKSNYKHVLQNDIVYNSMRMWQGACGVSHYEGIVSPAYTILIPLNNINPEFYGYYFKKDIIIHEFKKYSQGLTSDTWNLKYPLLSKIKISNPSLDEQNKIVNMFKIIEEKIDYISIQCNILKDFKEGLLQKMFC